MPKRLKSFKNNQIYQFLFHTLLHSLAVSDWSWSKSMSCSSMLNPWLWLSGHPCFVCTSWDKNLRNNNTSKLEQMTKLLPHHPYTGKVYYHKRQIYHLILYPVCHRLFLLHSAIHHSTQIPEYNKVIPHVFQKCTQILIESFPNESPIW